MSEQLRHGHFTADELVLVPEKRNPCVLGSGGPIMDALETREGGQVLCEWDDGRGWFHPKALRSLVPFRGIQ